MIKKAIVVFVFLVFSLSIYSQQIVTDRPDQTESSRTIPLRSFQVESGVLFSNSENGSIKQVLIPSTLLRYGLTKHVELRFVQQFESLKIKANSQKEFGISDIEIGTKIQLFREELITTEIAFLSHLILPTGSDALTADKFGTVNKLAISHELNHRLGLGYNLGYDYLGVGKGDFTYSAALGVGLGEKFGTYLELYGEYEGFSRWGSNFDSGLTYLLKNNLQFDISLGFGLSHKMHYFTLGCSWNIIKH